MSVFTMISVFLIFLLGLVAGSWLSTLTARQR
jgi:hypothetical protein